MFGLKTWIHAAGCVGRPLHAADLHDDPFQQCALWFAKAKRAGLPETNAMALATVGADGFPSQRMVLMKHLGAERGVVFYTNYGSRKSRELEAHPQAAVLFHFHILQRQIRITGTVERASAAESDAYFRTRARDSQLGAWASKQSEVLPDRDTFERRFAEVKKRFEGQEVPRPDFWGGYRLGPASFEFWQGRAYRLHDRFVYRPKPQGGWGKARLYP
jgi:pyridoxamine 5'-phosphate oxidase